MAEALRVNLEAGTLVLEPDDPVAPSTMGPDPQIRVLGFLNRGKDLPAPGLTRTRTLAETK